MPAAPPLAIVANPAAGRGRAARLIPRLRQLLGDRGIAHALHLTTHAHHELALARAAAESGAATILALGGDGTWGNVVRGIMASGRSPRLALLAAGTGNDLAFATGVPAHDLEAALAIALGAGERAIDVGEVVGVYFVNCAGFGFDAEVLRATQEVVWLRGHAVYLLTAARKLFGYPGFGTAISYAGAPGEASDARATLPPAATGPAHHLAVVVSNGPRFGGGFLIAPGARVDDGALDLVRVADGPPWRRLAVFAGATRGTHIGAPEVSRRAVREVTLTFDAPPLFDADGELHQAAGPTVTVRCHPGALRLAVEG
jgi:diacylglycerol kinase (ATP)